MEDKFTVKPSNSTARQFPERGKHVHADWHVNGTAALFTAGNKGTVLITVTAQCKVSGQAAGMKPSVTNAGQCRAQLDGLARERADSKQSRTPVGAPGHSVRN